MEKLEWSALEYEEKDRSSDWFLALGIIVVCSSVAAFIFENYFFAALLLLSGVLLGFFAIKKPDMISYELSDRGLKIRNQFYHYENIKSFWVQTDSSGAGELKPALFVKTERMFMPVISIPIEDAMSADIHSIMIFKNVAEEEMREHASSKIMDFLGF
ncbi:MAG: hypothetical protein AAB933_03685 [Patescibacteria group bacterium]